MKDIWDLRVAKLRKSTDTFVKSDATHAKVRVNWSFTHVPMENGSHAILIFCSDSGIDKTRLE